MKFPVFGTPKGEPPPGWLSKQRLVVMYLMAVAAMLATWIISEALVRSYLSGADWMLQPARVGRLIHKLLAALVAMTTIPAVIMAALWGREILASRRRNNPRQKPPGLKEIITEARATARKRSVAAKRR